MSELTIRNCIFGFKCSAIWEDLQETEDEAIKFCNSCQREVHYCSDDFELGTAVRLNRCVAIEKDDGGTVRLTLGDVIYDKS